MESSTICIQVSRYPVFNDYSLFSTRRLLTRVHIMCKAYSDAQELHIRLR